MQMYSQLQHNYSAYTSLKFKDPCPEMHKNVPFIILSDVGLWPYFQSGYICVLIQYMEVVVRRNPVQGFVSRSLSRHHLVMYLQEKYFKMPLRCCGAYLCLFQDQGHTVVTRQCSHLWRER